MKRETHRILFLENDQSGHAPGDDAAHRAAAALADRADAPTIAALTDMLAFLERVGGQYHLTALRLEGDAGWETAGLCFNFETRDARVKTAPGPEEVFGIPVTDSQAPPVELAAPQPEPEETEDEPDPDEDPVPAE